MVDQHSGRIYPDRRLLVFSGLAALAFGVLVYVVARGGNAIFVPLFLSGIAESPTIRELTYQVPTLVHTFAFCVLLTAIWASAKQVAVNVCVALIAFELLLELGQHDLFTRSIESILSIDSIDSQVFALVPRYFTNGTFDPLDVVSILVGGLLAIAVTRFSFREDKAHENN